MMDKLVYLTYPIILLALLWGGKFYRKGQWNEEFMTLKQTKYIQGFIALCIMLHHVGQETCASWQDYELRPGLEAFTQIGYLLVSVFLFCSGYGLYKSYKSKDDYLKGFIVKRIVPLIIAFYTSGWLYLIARVLMHEKMDGKKIFFYIIGWLQPSPFSWYVSVMPIFYLVFYLSFRFIKSEKAKIAVIVASVFAYTFLGTYIDHNDYWMRGEWWYNSVHLFWIGIIFARHEDKIIENMKRFYLPLLYLSLLGSYVVFQLSEIITNTVSYYGQYNPELTKTGVILNRWICLGSQMIAAILFVFTILLISLKLRIGNKYLGFMGGITLEFYLMHGLGLELFAREFCNILEPVYMIQNVALLEVVVFALGILSALVIKKLDNVILRLFTTKKKETGRL